MSTSVQDVKARYLDELMAVDGVVSVGIAADASHRPIIVVGLDRERPEAAAMLPAELEGYSVRIEIVGGIRAR